MRSKKKAVKKTSLSYPKLMENEAAVCLFKDATNGVVIHRKCRDTIPLGDDLLSAGGTFDIENFEDFEGTIELSNN